MGSITLSHFEEMSQSPLPMGIELVSLLLHMHHDQQKTQLALFCADVLFSQDMGKLMNPSVNPLKRFPICLCRLESFFQKML